MEILFVYAQRDTILQYPDLPQYKPIGFQMLLYMVHGYGIAVCLSSKDQGKCTRDPQINPQRQICRFWCRFVVEG